MPSRCLFGAIPGYFSVTTVQYMLLLSLIAAVEDQGCCHTVVGLPIFIVLSFLRPCSVYYSPVPSSCEIQGQRNSPFLVLSLPNVGVLPILRLLLILTTFRVSFHSACFPGFSGLSGCSGCPACLGDVSSVVSPARPLVGSRSGWSGEPILLVAGPGFVSRAPGSAGPSSSSDCLSWTVFSLR